MLWQITWNDGSIDIINSDNKPDAEAIESGVDADSPRWGHEILEIKQI
jgi:hypothetical protein